MADGEALIELLDTGDRMSWSSTIAPIGRTRLSGCRDINSIVNAAKEAGAFTFANTTWFPSGHRPVVRPTERGQRIGRSLRSVPSDLTTTNTSRCRLSARFLMVERCTGSPLCLPPRRKRSSTKSSNAPNRYCAARSNRTGRDGPTIESLARNGISDIFESLEAAGVVGWTGRGQIRLGSHAYPRGGIVRLTALGRYVLPDDLLDAGYVCVVDDLAGAPASALIDALDFVPDEQRQMVGDAWRLGSTSRTACDRSSTWFGSADDSSLRLRVSGPSNCSMRKS